MPDGGPVLTAPCHGHLRLYTKVPNESWMASIPEGIGRYIKDEFHGQ